MRRVLNGRASDETAGPRLTFQTSHDDSLAQGRKSSGQVTYVEDSSTFLMDEVNGVIQTIAIVASLLSTWGLTIYAASPSETKCPSAPLAMITLLEWVALGCFFFVRVLLHYPPFRFERRATPASRTALVQGVVRLRGSPDFSDRRSDLSCCGLRGRHRRQGWV